jgi:phosphatidylinositol 3-kinase
LYLLQLVQALKFEVKPSNKGDSSHTHRSRRSRQPSNAKVADHSPAEIDSGLADFLISRAVQNPVLGTALHWYLMVETEDRVVGKMFARVAFQFQTKLMEVSAFIMAQPHSLR